MILLAGVVIKASVLLAAAAAADVLMRRRASAAARHLIWTLAVAGVLVLPALSLTLPRWGITLPVDVAPLVGSSESARAIGGAVPVTESTATTSSDAEQATTSVNWAAIAIVAYLVGVAAICVRLTRERRALRHLLTRAHEAEFDWQSLLGECARKLHLGPNVCLLRSADDVMPMTCGVRAPTVLLPATAIEWTHDRREAVLLHELAHVARRDCLTQMLASIACAFYWPHPGVWWAARRLRIERELACDDCVVALGTKPDGYARDLLEIARSLGSRRAPVLALSMARRGQLEGRLLAVLDAARRRNPAGHRGLLPGLAAALVVIAPIAMLDAALAPVDPPTSFASFSASSDSQTPQSTAARQTAAPASQPSSQIGTWEIRPARDAGSVQLTLREQQSSWGRALPLSRFDGLSASDLNGTATVRFTSRRDAGTLSFEGVCRGGVCAGTFGFTADPGFGAELARRGIGRPTEAQQFKLAIADVGLAFVDALAAEQYKTPDLAAVIRAAEHGVDAGYVRDLASLGYRLGTVDALITTRDHGVDVEYIRSMAAAGFDKLPAETLVRARDHGVDAGFARGLRDVARQSLSLEELIKARDHGVDPKFASEMSGLGYKDLTLDALIRARDHGVDPKYMRDLGSVGYKDVAFESLIRLRDHGVTPDWIRKVQDQSGGHPDVDELIRRRDRGGDRR